MGAPPTCSPFPPSATSLREAQPAQRDRGPDFLSKAGFPGWDGAGVGGKTRGSPALVSSWRQQNEGHFKTSRAPKQRERVRGVTPRGVRRIGKGWEGLLQVEPRALTLPGAWPGDAEAASAPRSAMQPPLPSCHSGEQARRPV